MATRLAGYNPKKTPVAEQTPTARMTAEIEMVRLKVGGRMRTIFASTAGACAINEPEMARYLDAVPEMSEEQQGL